VEIRESGGTRKAKVLEVVSPKRRGFGFAGQYRGIATVPDVKGGDLTTDV